jgi:hypothetical protein
VLELETNPTVYVKEVKEALRRKITAFLHPLHGGPERIGWEIGQAFLVSGLLEFIQPDPQVGFITSIAVKAGNWQTTKSSVVGRIPLPHQTSPRKLIYGETTYGRTQQLLAVFTTCALVTRE